MSISMTPLPFLRHGMNYLPSMTPLSFLRHGMNYLRKYHNVINNLSSRNETSLFGTTIFDIRSFNLLDIHLEMILQLALHKLMGLNWDNCSRCWIFGIRFTSVSFYTL